MMQEISLIIVLIFLCFSSCSFQEFKYTKTKSGVEFSINGIKKRISFYADNIVRISLVKNNKDFIDSSLVVVSEPEQTNFTISDDKELRLETNSLIVEVDKGTGAISFLDLNDKPYLLEDKDMQPELNDTIILNQPYYKIKQTFKLTKEEGLYGLGQFQNGYMNYRNKDLLLVQANKIAIVPMLTSTNNYGILWDNYSKSTFHDGADATWFTSEVADQIDYYFIGGRNIDNVISGYRTLTGKAPMFSKKAYGYWQSKQRYTSFNELHDVVRKYRENHIPLDNIVQDWRYWGDNNMWSSMYFEPENFGNPSENIEKLHSNHVDLMVTIWPALGPDTEIYKEMDSQGLFLNQGHWSGGKVFDVYNPRAREIYWKHLKKGLVDKGVDAFWMDGTEPEFFGTGDQETTEKEILKVGKTAIGPIAKYLNTYALVTSENIYQKQRGFTDKKRVFILARSSWAGQQRNATATWSGDIAASFDILKKQVSAGINFCMAGVPYWMHDIGAYFIAGGGGMHPKGIEDPAYQELYARWFQFGAFSPIFRAHGSGTPREVWQFKDRNPMIYDALLKTINLRYQLLPYVYSTAWNVTHNDYTLMRGLVMDFSYDRNTYDIIDQYMFGPSIMVKPVTKSMYYKVEELPTTIPTTNLLSTENKNGLNVTFFKDMNLQEPVHKDIDKEVNHNWAGGGMPPGVLEDTFSARWEGKLVPPESGKYTIALYVDDGIRLWIDGNLVIDKWKRDKPTLHMHEIELEDGKEYPIKIEFFQETGNAIVELAWVTPSENDEETVMDKTDEVYLPEYKGWYDFWTNEYYKGGQTISKEFPIDIFPLFVKAGSIIPIGPEQQYVDEKTNGPIEIRIYAGEDAEFVYYEDEGNNYNYEKGGYNTIRFSWNDGEHKLRIGESTGSFKGYVEGKIFKIAVIDPTLKSDKNKALSYKACNYNGKENVIDFR